MKIRKIYSTIQDSDCRLSEVNVGSVVDTGSSSAKGQVEIHPDRLRQEILGFGGAFTEAMADALGRMPTLKKEEALEAYFHPENGIGYNFCRSHMNSCDFSLGNYDCLKRAGDIELDTFNIERDKQYLLPLIERAFEISVESVKLYISPWSPPSWMKTNGQMQDGGSLKPEFYELWANYFVKFIQAYDVQGIQVWGLTLQNEPLAHTRWENCIYTHAQEREFCKILSKVLESNGLGDVKIIIWDHNKDCLKERIDVIFSDLEAYDATFGVGFHWYGSTDSESKVDNTALDYIFKCYPDKKLIFTEGCNPLRSHENYFDEWWTGEKYGMHIIEDLNHGTAAWTDWNMVLDERGGPNHVGNYCDAPIIANTVTGELIYQSSYYYIGHLSKFIPAGSRIVLVTMPSGLSELYATAASTPDGNLTVVVMNGSDEVRTIELNVEGWQQCLHMAPHSIQTLIMSP